MEEKKYILLRLEFGSERKATDADRRLIERFNEQMLASVQKTIGHVFEKRDYADISYWYKPEPSGWAIFDPRVQKMEPRRFKDLAELLKELASIYNFEFKLIDIAPTTLVEPVEPERTFGRIILPSSGDITRLRF